MAVNLAFTINNIYINYYVTKARNLVNLLSPNRECGVDVSQLSDILGVDAIFGGRWM